MIVDPSLNAALRHWGVRGVPFADNVGEKPSLHRSRNLSRLEDTLKELGRITPVLLLDDAQDYPPGALEEVRLLLGLNLPRQPVFALVLIGDLYLQEILRLAHHRSLYSRI